MNMATPPRVFPLHLSPIEKLLVADDHPQYPMTFVLESVFSGAMDRRAFELALPDALARHPLLTAHIQPAKQSAPCWVSAGERMPPVVWGGEDLPICHPHGERIDLRNEVGLRIWVCQGRDQVRLVTQFHHACCDGVGAYQFLGDLLALYAANSPSASPPPKLRSLDLSRLRRRAHGCMPVATSNQFRLQARSSLPHAYQMLIRGCTPLRPATVNGNGPSPTRPDIHTLEFSPGDHRNLRLAASDAGVTLNDLLLNELFFAMRDWNAGGGRDRRRWRLRVMMPVCLRDRADLRTPASNIMGYTFVTRRASQLGSDRQQELQALKEETSRVRNRQAARRFVDTIAAAAAYPGLLSVVAKMPRTLATVIFSNLGDPTRRFTTRFPRQDGRLLCGNLRLESVTGVPPLRPRTRAALLVLSYNDYLTINLRCDPHRFSSQDTDALLLLFGSRLQGILDNPGGSCVSG